MYYVQKLKINKRVTGLLPAFFSLVVFGISSVLLGMGPGLSILGLLIIIYAIFQAIAAYRTRSIGYTVSAAYLLTLGLYINMLHYDKFSYNKIVLTHNAKFLFVIVLALLAWLVYMLFTKRVKWRGREIMELAALDVEPGSDTYTDRPRPIKKIEYNKDQLIHFAEFLKKNLIAMPFYESERIVFVPVKMGYEFPFVYGGNINYWNKSWVAFDFSGQVSTHISKDDYLDFKENLAFDALCEGLGQQFIEFFELYKKGEQVRIIDKVNEIKIGFFS